MKTKIELQKNYILIAAVFLIIFTISAFIRKPHEAEGFYMSDATYHVLLTMQAYDETPSSIHHWLPIQTYGSTYDKDIMNGPSLLQDEFGNSYYVSFSPLGFSVPYFFCKIFHLDLTVDSLYIFNCLCMLLSAVLVGFIMYMLFKKQIIFWLSVVVYMFLPEVLYTQGIVYWHHSLTQVFLLLQTILFILLFIEKRKNKGLLLLFFIVSFVYPYSEWTGYICNIGMALGILVLDFKIEKDENQKRRFSLATTTVAKVFVLAVITISAFGYYIYRFSIILSVSDIISTMTSRAGARSEASLTTLLTGYKNSYLPLLMVVIMCLGIALLVKSSRKKLADIFIQKKYLVVITVFIFPIFENLLMMEHAISYTFDRLKGATILIFIFIVSVYALGEISKKVVWIVTLFSSGFIIIAGLGTYSSGKTMLLSEYQDTIIMRDYLQENYIDGGKCMLVKDGWRAWGYLQTLYHRNIYCTALYSENQLEEIAFNTGRDYIVVLKATSEYGDTSCYTKAVVIELSTSNVFQLSVLDGKVISEEIVELYAAEITDVNWTNGIFNFNNAEILFNNTSYNYAKLETATKIYCNGEVYNIVSMNSDSNWIHVYVDKDATDCGYPSVLKVE
ncbi:MAG: hypothetical protein J6J42_03580 [Lachnospiraceae bacterium]|nr:hypothetical protein [Lachnospiraceae bacterium]